MSLERVANLASNVERPWLLSADTRLPQADGAEEAPIRDMTVVICHFAQMLGADGWAVTLVGDSETAVLLANDGLRDDQIDPVIRLATQTHSQSFGPSLAPVWMEALGASRPTSALVFTPCSAKDGSCAVVTLIFANEELSKRHGIEVRGIRHWPSVAAFLRLWLSARVEQQRIDGIEAGLDLLAIGVVLLSNEGRVVFANDAAKALIDSHDGIRVHRGQLQATNRCDMTPLSNAIGYALAGTDGIVGLVVNAPLLTLNRQEGPPLIASFMPIPHMSGTKPSGALGFFIDPGLDVRQLAEPVCKLYNLSRVETELACLLASGFTLARAAQTLHVKIDTARGYLKHIFIKTGRNRQVDLIRLIFSNIIRTHAQSLKPISK